MSGVRHDRQLAVAPDPRKLPCGDQWRCEIEPTLHHHPGDAGEPLSAAQEDAVLEPAVVVEVVRDDPCPRHPVTRIGPPLRRLCVGIDGNGSRLPVVPVGSRLLADRGIGIVEQIMVGGDKVALPPRLGDAGSEFCPLLGKERR